MTKCVVKLLIFPDARGASSVIAAGAGARSEFPPVLQAALRGGVGGGGCVH